MQHRPKKILLTFDIEGWAPGEDYFDDLSAECLRTVLRVLEQENFRGIFFITGSIAEQIREYPDVVDLLRSHRIGYHSSAHNAKPGIISLTDVPSYKKAVNLSIERETSHINLTKNKLEGKGGLLALKQTFPEKKVECFRAPFFGWSPPHLEALKGLGIKYDFSAYLSDYPVFFKGIVFYPIPIALETLGFFSIYRENRGTFVKSLSAMLLQREVSVLSLHPSALLLKDCFVAAKRRPKGGNMLKLDLCLLTLMFKRIQLLQKFNLIQVSPFLGGDHKTLDLAGIDVRRVFWRSVHTPIELFNHNPKHVYSHFVNFFSLKSY